MITNTLELKVAIRNLGIMEEALRALRLQMESTNPKMFKVTSEPYHHRISLLQKSIAEYLSEHPSEVSSILPPLSQEGMSNGPVLPPVVQS